MEMREFGRTGLRVSVLGFGGAEIGFEHATPEAVERLLLDALDSGLNVIDTAECYHESEELIGRAVSTRRKDYYLFTKCGHPEGAGGIEDWRPRSLLESIERSLRRLRTDAVDLVQLHSCSEAELRKGDAIGALDEARRKGYTRFIGYSGDGPAARYAVECGLFDTLQTSVSIADQEAIDTTLPLAAQKGLGVIAKRPIANAAWKYAEKPENAYHVPYWERLRALKYDFLGLKPEEIASIALRFTMMAPAVDTMIVGTKNPDRWRENARLIASETLPPDVFESIRQRWREVADAGWGGQT